MDNLRPLTGCLVMVVVVTALGIAAAWVERWWYRTHGRYAPDDVGDALASAEADWEFDAGGTLCWEEVRDDGVDSVAWDLREWERQYNWQQQRAETYKRQLAECKRELAVKKGTAQGQEFLRLHKQIEGLKSALNFVHSELTEWERKHNLQQQRAWTYKVEAGKQFQRAELYKRQLVEALKELAEYQGVEVGVDIAPSPDRTETVSVQA